MTIHMIWAESADGFIGENGSIPWHVPEDLQHFKNFTLGKTVVMGRKTWESLGCQALSSRLNIVLTKQGAYSPFFTGGAKFYSNIQCVINSYKNLWVIGGKQIYDMFMPYADHIVKTEIDVFVNGKPNNSVRAPKVYSDTWREVGYTGTLQSVTGTTYRIKEYIRND